jgi:tetratricopeptide (TPR) repeat protein
MRLDPHYPFTYVFWLGHVFHSLQRYDDAVAAYQRTIGRNPDFLYARLWLAASYAELDRTEEAKAEAAVALRISPDLSCLRLVQRLPLKDAAVLARLVEGMRKAGLLE